jgi:hypothetical protein
VPSDGLRFEKRQIVLDDVSEIDEEEIRIQNEIAQRVGLHPPAYEGSGRGCCIRRWDTADTPLMPCSSDDNSLIARIVSQFYQVNNFREKLQANFSKIISGSSTPIEEPTTTV